VRTRCRPKIEDFRDDERASLSRTMRARSSRACGFGLRRPHLALSVRQVPHRSREKTRSRLDCHPSPNPPRPRRVTLPSAIVRPGARFIARPTERLGTPRLSSPHSLRSRGRGRAGCGAVLAWGPAERSEAGLVRACSDGGLKGRGVVRDRSAPRAFWLLLISFLPSRSGRTNWSVHTTIHRPGRLSPGRPRKRPSAVPRRVRRGGRPPR